MVEQENNDSNNPPSSSVVVTFQVKKRKLRTDHGGAATTTATREAFAEPAPTTATDTLSSTSLLVIPPIPDTIQWKHNNKNKEVEELPNFQTTNSVDSTTPATIKKEEEADVAEGVVSDAEAIRALQAESALGSHNKRITTTSEKPIIELPTSVSSGSVIPTTSSTTITTTKTCDEDEPYRRDLERLPPALEETSDAYERIPITEFGAALLRGMGWKDNSNHNNNYDNNPNPSEQLPRPHRLGLGAIPAMAEKDMEDDDDKHIHHRRIQRPEEYEKQQKLKQQNALYRQEQERHVQRDKQRVLQNGSLVWIRRGDDDDTRRRAEILQLVGVPGLNRVQIRYEGDTEPTIIQRREIDRLITRPELETVPFQYPKNVSSSNHKKYHPAPTATSSPQQQDTDRNNDQKDLRMTTTKSKEKTITSSSDRKRELPTTDDTKKKRKHHDRSGGDGKQDRSLPVTWLIPNIRVRVITERFGRRYYKEKGIVTDVTWKGATLQMYDRNNSSNNNNNNAVVVLQHVPERYLETALPKVGGPAVILTGPHKYAKGTLLERDSKKGTGVLQIFEDMSVLTLSLDDMAEWCGPLDDTL